MATTPPEWKRNVRYSVRQLEKWAEAGHRKPLENLIRAWKGIAELPVDDPNSYWVIAGYHGSPLPPFDADNPDIAPPFLWWGGYCHHANVLFPLWHRAYVQHLEDALRIQVPDVSLAYWDQTSEESRTHGLPRTLTDDTVELDEEPPSRDTCWRVSCGGAEQPSCGVVVAAMRALLQEIPNPFLNYEFPVDIESTTRFKNPKQPTADFSKRAGTVTQRYPMSGFYASKIEEVAADGRAHNEAMIARFPTHDDRVRALNANVLFGLTGAVPEADALYDPTLAGGGETFSRLSCCLDAPTYNYFSNHSSAGKWYTSVEQPHDEMHLALGGQDQRRSLIKKKRDVCHRPSRGSDKEILPLTGSNGDMGENETAAFDPIFFFHHVNIDRLFWVWQKKWGKTAEGTLDIDPTDTAGTYGQAPGGQGGTRTISGTTKLTMDTPLHPFKSPSGGYYTSRDLVDIRKQLGVDYSSGSLDQEEWPEEVETRRRPEVLFSVLNINKAAFMGSFTVTLFHQDDEEVLTPLESVSVLSRWNLKRCKNCQIYVNRDVHLDLTPLKKRLAGSDVARLTYVVQFVDRTATKESPVAASGIYEDGEWTVLTGSQKIGKVHIELEASG